MRAPQKTNPFIFFVLVGLFVFTACQNNQQDKSDATKKPKFDIRQDEITKLMQALDWQEAVFMLEELNKETTDNAANHFRLGLAHENLGNFNEAGLAYEQALKIKPDFGEVYSQMAGLSIKMGNLDKALEQFNRAQEIFPESSEIGNNIGSMYVKLGKWEEAIEAYLKALKIADEQKADTTVIKKNLGNACYQFGMIQEQQQDSRAAIKYYELAIQNISNFHEAVQKLGLLYIKEGDMLKALETFKKSDKIRRPDQTLDQK